MIETISRKTGLALAIAATIALAGCAGERGEEPADETPPPITEPAAPTAESETAATVQDKAPVDLFLERIAEHCGQSFEGRIVANDPPAGEPPMADDPFVGKTLVMHVRECSDGELKVPFHVGDDHSRTWILTRTETGLRLKHDHRHEDGSDDAVTMYGGDTATPGTEQRQEFPVDAESIELFEREGLPASVTNTWAMEIEPNKRFLYELSRPTGRLFQGELDLSRPGDTPPTPWGHE